MLAYEINDDDDILDIHRCLMKNTIESNVWIYWKKIFNGLLIVCPAGIVDRSLASNSEVRIKCLSPNNQPHQAYVPYKSKMKYFRQCCS